MPRFASNLLFCIDDKALGEALSDYPVQIVYRADGDERMGLWGETSLNSGEFGIIRLLDMAEIVAKYVKPPQAVLIAEPPEDGSDRYIGVAIAVNIHGEKFVWLGEMDGVCDEKGFLSHPRLG